MYSSAIKVLIVDDMLTMRKVIEKTCKALGLTDVTLMDNGSSAWEALNGAQRTFDLVISDWNMPGSTGLDLLKRVRADSRYKGVPFLMVTAETEKSQVQEAMGAGVSAYIVKPFTLETLKAKLDNLVPKAA